MHCMPPFVIPHAIALAITDEDGMNSISWHNLSIPMENWRLHIGQHGVLFPPPPATANHPVGWRLPHHDCHSRHRSYRPISRRHHISEDANWA